MGGTAALRQRRWSGLPLFVQVAALLIGGLVLAQLVLVALVLSTGDPGPPSWVATMTRALNRGESGNGIAVTQAAEPPRDDHEDRFERELRLMLAQDLGVPFERVRVTLGGHVAGAGGDGQRIALPQERTLHLPHRPDTLIGALHLPDGSWRIAREESTGWLRPWQQRLLTWILAALLVLLPVAWAFARRITKPIAAFAAAADRFGRDPASPPLALKGPAELGVAAQAMNVMQARLRRYVEDRTAMIGAIAHDLRTPLTRLRFRLEDAPEALRGKAAADIAEMEAMVGAVLAFVRDAARPAGREPLELRSLVESIADNMNDLGREVTVEPGDAAVVAGDPVSLRALLTNLIDNAVQYGERARVRLRRETEAAVVEVDDGGPGLPAEECERVFEPFYRLERSRCRNTGGIGLGLAVVRAHALAHGGSVTLANRAEGGLRATLRLPL